MSESLLVSNLNENLFSFFLRRIKKQMVPKQENYPSHC